MAAVWVAGYITQNHNRLVHDFKSPTREMSPPIITSLPTSQAPAADSSMMAARSAIEIVTVSVR